MSYIEDVLLLSHNYEIDFFKNLILECPIVSATQSGELIEIELDSIYSEVKPGMYIFIPTGKNSGYHEIILVNDNIVSIAETLDSIYPDTNLSIYAINYNLVKNYIDIAIIQAERITGLPLLEESILTEYHDGNHSEEILLDRKSINELVSVSIKSGELVSSVPIQSFSIIPGQGILIYRNSIDGNGFKFPTGENNVIITYKSGYDYSTIPSDIKLAISCIALYNILQDENAFTGGGGSISVVSYSQSYGAEGKFSEIKKSLLKNSKMILNKYRSGVVGG